MTLLWIVGWIVGVLAALLVTGLLIWWDSRKSNDLGEIPGWRDRKNR